MNYDCKNNWSSAFALYIRRRVKERWILHKQRVGWAAFLFPHNSSMKQKLREEHVFLLPITVQGG